MSKAYYTGLFEEQRLIGISWFNHLVEKTVEVEVLAEDPLYAVVKFPDGTLKEVPKIDLVYPAQPIKDEEK